MSVINQLPKGLQEFLGNTAAGVNPSDLLQTVMPTFDMTPYWAANHNLNVTTNNGAVTQSGVEIFIGPIPFGEIWVPIWMSGNLTGIDEGDDWRGSINYYARSGEQPVTLATGDTYSNPSLGPTGNNQYSVGYTWPQRFLAVSGNIFSVNSQHVNFTQPSETVVATLHHYVLKA